MTRAFIASEYSALQEAISQLQKKYYEKIEAENLLKGLENKLSKIEVPLIVLSKTEIPSEEYLTIIHNLVELLLEHHPEIKTETDQVLKLLHTDLAERWISEVLAFNSNYFTRFAEENQLADWLPYFLAEQAIRPYLRVLAEYYQELLNQAEITTLGCPCCGEPIRLGQLQGDGQKELVCPRCHAHWPEKRLKCSHCGNEDHQTLSYLTVEGNSTEQVHVCTKCNNYTKIIDIRQMIDKPDPTMLDLKTVYLDYVAQEKGFIG